MPQDLTMNIPRGMFNMTAVSVVEAQTHLIEHNIVRALDAQVG